jgi:hypothetical protein
LVFKQDPDQVVRQHRSIAALPQSQTTDIHLVSPYSWC